MVSINWFEFYNSFPLPLISPLILFLWFIWKKLNMLNEKKSAAYFPDFQVTFLSFPYVSFSVICILCTSSGSDGEGLSKIQTVQSA